MARLDKYTITEGTLTDIGDAIRSKTGGTADIDPVDMPQEILDIPSGGGGVDPVSLFAVTGVNKVAFEPPERIVVDVSDVAMSQIRERAFTAFIAPSTSVSFSINGSQTSSIFYNSELASLEFKTEESFSTYSAIIGNFLTITEGPIKITGGGSPYLGGAVIAKCSPLYIIVDTDSLQGYGSLALAYDTALGDAAPFVICFPCIEHTMTAIGASAIVSQAAGTGSAAEVSDIYVAWSEGAVANAPWGATNAVIHYDTTFDADGYPNT